MLLSINSTMYEKRFAIYVSLTAKMSAKKVLFLSGTEVEEV